jgi:hypothetical protein
MCHESGAGGVFPVNGEKKAEILIFLCVKNLRILAQTGSSMVPTERPKQNSAMPGIPRNSDSTAAHAKTSAVQSMGFLLISAMSKNTTFPMK